MHSYCGPFRPADDLLSLLHILCIVYFLLFSLEKIRFVAIFYLSGLCSEFVFCISFVNIALLVLLVLL